MKIAGRATLDELGRSTWPAFADDIGLPVPFVRRRGAELAEAVHANASATAERPARAGLDVPALQTYAGLIGTRAELVARSAVATTPAPARRRSAKG